MMEGTLKLACLTRATRSMKIMKIKDITAHLAKKLNSKLIRILVGLVLPRRTSSSVTGFRYDPSMRSSGRPWDPTQEGISR